MSKKKVTLEEAKKILDTDKVFYNGGNKFNVVDTGKYHSGITLEIPQEWTINKRREPESPINYISSKELTDGMNIDFNGDANILLGKFRLSKNGRPVFELTDPSKARDTLIRVSWGGSFNKTYGCQSEYAEKVGASFFTRRTSNGRGLGKDYWILPVNFVKDMEPRDVSAILKNIEQKENSRIEEIDKYIEQEDLAIKNSIENRTRILEELSPIIENLQALYPDFQYRANAENFQYTYDDSYFYPSMSSRYTDELVIKLSNLLEKKQNEKLAREKYTPLYQEMEDTLDELNFSITYNDLSITLSYPNSRSEDYKYSQEGYTSFIDAITRYQEKINKEKEEARRKAEELKRAAELKRKKEEAKKLGYPENFEFHNRLSGVNNLGHAYVIERDGTIRNPDYNILRNHNHIHNSSDWKNCADGTQGYEQILPGEIIVTYQKACRAVPYTFNVEWADDNITDAQLDVVWEELSEKASFAATKEGKEITDIEKWIIGAVRKKAIECKKQLKQHAENSFAEEIVNLAEEKNKASDKNKQAESLVQAYEKQFLSKENQQSLEDN